MGAEGENNNEQKENQVTMSKEDYEQLLNNIANLTNQVSTLTETSEKERNDREADRQRQEADRQRQNRQPIDLDNLSRQDFGNLILAEVHKMIERNNSEKIDPLAQIVVSTVVNEEVADARRQYDDFDEFKDEILEIAGKNSSLSIKEAYHLAKSNNPKKAAEVAEKRNRQKEQPTGGEKPGPSSGTFQPGGKMSLEEAVAQAAKAMEGKS